MLVLWSRLEVAVGTAGPSPRPLRLAISPAPAAPHLVTLAVLVPSPVSSNRPSLACRPYPGPLDLCDQLPYNSDNIVLFKGIDEARMNGLFDEQDQLARLERIISLAPSDFSGKRGRYYFTDNRNVAEFYAASYTKRRGNCESVCMIAVTIPRDQIEALPRASNADTDGDDAAQELRAYDLCYPSPQ